MPRVICMPLAVLTPLAIFAPLRAQAAERVTLTNGFAMTCDHTQVEGSKTLLFLDAGSSNYIAVASSEITATETAPLPAPEPAAAAAPAAASGLPAAAHRPPSNTPEVLTERQLAQLLRAPGAAHDLDIDLLVSVVDAESSRHSNARSRAGAEGLMQLMPGTARELGVADPLVPRQNVSGGTAYLDALLRRYHDNLALALAAYNAGPAAVDRWHGIPPYRETRAYVARIIHEFNRRYAARQAAALASLEP